MRDLISRQTALDAIEKTIKANSSIHYEMRYWEDGMNCAKNILEDLPSAQAEHRWIPCKEMLPENSDTVLITHRGGVSVGWHNGRYWERGASTNHRPLTTVLAWMPLPKPWKGEEE